MADITQILNAIAQGDTGRSEILVAQIYSELHQMALARLRSERKGNGLQATELVNEVYLRICTPATGSSVGTRQPTFPEDTAKGEINLFAGRSDDQFVPNDSGQIEGNSNAHPAQPLGPWQNRAHFFAAAAEAMRRILIEAARRRLSLKRGGDRLQTDIDLEQFAVGSSADELIAVDDLLAKLESVDAAAAQLVKLRVFAGFKMAEIAEILQVSPRTGQDLWSYAKAWLREQMQSH